ESGPRRAVGLPRILRARDPWAYQRLRGWAAHLTIRILGETHDQVRWLQRLLPPDWSHILVGSWGWHRRADWRLQGKNRARFRPRIARRHRLDHHCAAAGNTRALRAHAQRPSGVGRPHARVSILPESDASCGDSLPVLSTAVAAMGVSGRPVVGERLLVRRDR